MLKSQKKILKKTSTTKNPNKKNNRSLLVFFSLTQSYDCKGSFMTCCGLPPYFLNACG